MILELLVCDLLQFGHLMSYFTLKLRKNKYLLVLVWYYYIILETVNCNDVIILLYKQYNLFEMYVIVYTKCHVKH